MTLYLRLLAGLTSFMSNLHLSQACSIGPEGILASSFTLVLLSQRMTPVNTATGMEMKPAAMTMARPAAQRLSSGV